MKWKFWERPKEIGTGIFTPEQVAQMRPGLLCKVVSFRPEAEEGVVRATLEVSLGRGVCTEVVVRLLTTSVDFLEGRTIPAAWEHHRSGLQVTALKLANLSPDSDREDWARVLSSP